MAGMARLLRGYSTAALENVALWHERDISHSSAERVIIPDACTVLHYMLVTFTRLMVRLEVNAARMRSNLDSTGGLVVSGALLSELIQQSGLSRDDAYRIVQRNAAAVLDGGWRRWSDEGRASSTAEASYAPTTFSPTADLDRFADLDEVNAFVESGGSCLINALGRDQHSGADGGRTYGRAGHIPGSTNVPAMELIDPDTGLYRPSDELAGMFAEVAPDKSQRVVTYCGGGIAASNDALVLSLLGYENVAVYDASMSEYAADESLPLAVD